jgi:hypothetical protein
MGVNLFLTPFIKSHKHNTMQALDASLKLLAQIDSGACEIRDLALNQQII